MAAPSPKVLDRGMTNLELSQEMMRAAASDNLEAVERCLAEGTSPNAVNPIGQTALHIAAIWNNVKVATKLIEAGGQLSPPNQYGATPLHFAAQKGHVEFCQLLVAQRAQSDPLAVHQLGSRASSGQLSRLLCLLRALLARLWVAWHSQGEAGPLGAQPLPRVLERAASKAAHVTTL